MCNRNYTNIETQPNINCIKHTLIHICSQTFNLK